MLTRSKAAKASRVESQIFNRLREEDESLASKDSGIVCRDHESLKQAKRIETSENLRQNKAKRNQTNFLHIDKSNDGSSVTRQKNDSQRKKSVEHEEIEKNEKRVSQCANNRDWKEKLEWLQARRDVGLWIQCCRETCQKWRFTDAIHDPVDVPEMWYCEMQLDSPDARCDYPEQKIAPHIRDDLIDNKYNAGSIVWVHIMGYPWWPAIVDDCPLTFRYYELRKKSNIPIKYNVTYFGTYSAEYTWIPDRNLRPYQSNPKDVFLYRKRMTYRGINYRSQVERACVEADEALQLSTYERLRRYSFIARTKNNDQKQVAKRSKEAHNRTCQVKKVCDDNLIIANKIPTQQTASTSAIYSQTSVESQEKSKGENPEIFAFEKYPKTNAKRHEGTQRLSVSAWADNTKRKKAIPNEMTTQKMACTSRISLQARTESRKKIEKISNVALENKIRSIEKISSDEASTRQNPSIFVRSPQTSIKRQNDIQEHPQVTLDNPKRAKTIPNETMAQELASIFKTNSQISVQSQKETQKISEIVLNNKIQSIEKISSDEASTRENASSFGKYPQASVESQKRIQILPQVASNSITEESSISNKITAQQTASTSSTCNQVCVGSQKENKRPSEVASNNKSQDTQRTSNDEGYKRFLVRLMAHLDVCEKASAFGQSTQAGIESQKGIQRFSQVASNNKRSKRSILNETTTQQTASTSAIYSQTSAESKVEIERSSKIVSSTNSQNSKDISGDEARKRFIEGLIVVLASTRKDPSTGFGRYLQTVIKG